MTQIAFTTTIPQEYIWASGAVPVDLNNLFISGEAKRYIKLGEKFGVPRNTCSWIKGLMGVVVEKSCSLDAVIAVTQGDCSNNHGLINLYKHYLPELKVISFSYPSDRDPNNFRYELDKLGDSFGVSYEQATEVKSKLDLVRERLCLLDELFFVNKNISALEFQKLMVASSDFNGNYNSYAKQTEDLIKKSESTEPLQEELAIGYLGVPTILSDLFSYLEDELSVKIAYFEVENDFAMFKNSRSLVEQYQLFNYPYDLATRIQEISKQIKARNLKGIIHYVQTFCHRQIDDVIIKNCLNIPVLTMEGDGPGELDMRTKIRIECFVERLREGL